MNLHQNSVTRYVPYLEHYQGYPSKLYYYCLINQVNHTLITEISERAAATVISNSKATLRKGEMR